MLEEDEIENVPWMTPEIEPFSAMTSGGRARRALVRASVLLLALHPRDLGPEDP